MKEDLITFETAKLAKEKKFRELCTSAYSEDVDGIVTSENNNGYLFYNGSLSDDVAGFTSAPTQALLQKWLREKFGIDLYCYPNYSGKGKTFQMNLYTDPYHENWERVIHIYKGGYDTYEEALEKGLQEALKLIKYE